VAGYATITVTLLKTEFFERWCVHCINTEPHVRVYMRIGRDSFVKVWCCDCQREPVIEDA